MRSTSSKRIRASALCTRFSASFPQSEVTVAYHPARPSSHFSGKRSVYEELIKGIRDRSTLLLFFVHEPQAHKGRRITGPNRSCACYDCHFSSNSKTVSSTIQNEIG